MWGKTEDKRIGALALCSFTVPVVLFLSQSQWEAVILVLSTAVLVTIFGKPTQRIRVSRDIKLLSMILLVWNLGVIGKFAREISNLQGVDNPLPGLLLLILASYAAKKKIVPIVAAVLLFALVLTYGGMYLFSIPDWDLKRLLPKENKEVWQLAYGFMPMLLLYVYKDDHRKSRALWMGTTAILGLGAVIVTQALGAPNFYTAAKSVNVLGAMERLEPFVSAAVTAGGFCLFGMLITIDQIIWEDVFKQKKKMSIRMVLGHLCGDMYHVNKDK